MANRGTWEAIATAGPTALFVRTDTDINRLSPCEIVGLMKPCREDGRRGSGTSESEWEEAYSLVVIRHTLAHPVD